VRRYTKTLTGSEFLAISPLQQVQRALIEARMADKHRDSFGLTTKRRSSSCVDPLAAAKHKLANATPKGSVDDIHNRDMTAEVKTACLLCFGLARCELESQLFACFITVLIQDLQQQCKLTLGVALTLQEAVALVTDLATPGTTTVRGVHFLRGFFKAGDEHKSALAAAAVQHTAAARTRHSRTAAELAASTAAAAVLSTPHTHADAAAARTLLAAAAHAAATASGDSSLNSIAVTQAFAGPLTPCQLRAQIARCWGAAAAGALTVAQLAAVFAAVDSAKRGIVQGEAFLKWVAGASAGAKAAAAQRAQRNAAARVRVLTAAGVQCAPLQPALLGR
jgi:hypothetical protein